jgi:alkanesulfonate monooxygenase SsuD/methylene tetrahydromethanopterin reductase-like flavin-dependent oxidoreductase (luciferase family)
VARVEFGFVAGPVEERGTPDAALYEEVLADCEHHAALGYRTVWMIEHHFSDYFPTPSPLTYLAFVAGRFPELALGTCVLVTPWYDPLRLAEEIAMLSHLTSRPLHLGLGRGTATFEYEAFGLDMNDARARFREAWEVIDLALSGEPFTYAGRFVRVPREIRLRPLPARDRINFYGAVVSASSAPIMAELGLAPICTSIGDLEEPARVLRAWEDAAAGRSASPHRVIMITTIVADTDEEALAQARTYVPRYMEAQVRHYRADEVEIARLCGYEQWARTFARWQELTDPAAVDGWTAGQLVGSPETVRRRLAAFVEAGFDHVIVHTSTPCVPRAVRHRWADLFAREVAPRFSAAFAPA